MEEQIKDIKRPKRVPRKYVVRLAQGGEISYHTSYHEACKVAGLEGDTMKIHSILNRFKYHQKDWMLKGIQVDVENIAPFTVRRIQFREV